MGLRCGGGAALHKGFNEHAPYKRAVPWVLMALAKITGDDKMAICVLVQKTCTIHLYSGHSSSFMAILDAQKYVDMYEH